METEINYWFDMRHKKAEVNQFHQDLADFITELKSWSDPDIDSLIRRFDIRIYRDSFQDATRVMIDGI